MKLPHRLMKTRKEIAYFDSPVPSYPCISDTITGTAKSALLRWWPTLL